VRDPADFLQHWRYAGLFAVILAEEAGVPLPVPGDLFIAAMGFLAGGAPRAYVATAAVVTAATVLGASILYAISRHAGRRVLVRIARRFGYTEAREARLEAWLARRGAAAVVLGRLVPGLRIVMTVVAGILRLRRATFVTGTFFAGLVWATIYFWIGCALGAGYERLGGRALASEAWPWVVALACAASVLGLWWRSRRAAAARGRGGAGGAGAPQA